jgi:hypothetical protein
MLLTALAGLWVVRRVCGPLRPWDAVVLLLFLTTSSAETYTAATNLAHGPLSAFFLVVLALALTVQSHSVRCALIVAVNFLAVNTGQLLSIPASSSAGVLAVCRFHSDSRVGPARGRQRLAIGARLDCGNRRRRTLGVRHVPVDSIAR